MRKITRWLDGEVTRIEGYAVLLILVGFLTFQLLKLESLLDKLRGISGG